MLLELMEVAMTFVGGPVGTAREREYPQTVQIAGHICVTMYKV